MPVVKVGLLAQTPAGKEGKRVYGHLSIEQRTVKNIRAVKYADCKYFASDAFYPWKRKIRQKIIGC